jgi:hypothetical protein
MLHKPACCVINIAESKSGDFIVEYLREFEAEFKTKRP